MKKQVKKWLTLIMAFALILGSVRYNPLSASATEVSDPEIVDTASGGDSGESDTMEEGSVSGDMDTVSGDIVSGPLKAQVFGMLRNARAAVTTRYYTFNDITRTGGYGNTANVTSAGVLEISYDGQYQEIQYSLPAEVDGKTLEKITFKVSGGDVSNLAIKVLKDGVQAQVEYGKDTITVTADLSTASTIGFALMNNASTAADYVIDYFSITAEQTGGLENPPTAGTETTRYYTFNDVTKVGSNGASATETVTAAGGLNVSYGGQYSEIKYSLPAGVEGKTLEKIEFKVSGENAYDLAVKVYVDGAEKQVAYHNGAITVTEDLSAGGTITIGLMNNASAAADYVIDYFSITAEQTGGLENPPVDLAVNTTPETTSDYDRRFTVKDGGLTVLSADGVTYTPQDVEKIYLEFSDQWKEIKFALPEVIDLTYGKAVTFAVSSQSVPMSFKLYDTEGNEVKAEYSKTGNCTMDIGGKTDKIASVAIMLHSARL